MNRDGVKILEEFVNMWKSSFKPDLEKKWCFSDKEGWSNKNGKWLISREWSFYLMSWLKDRFGKVIFEVGCDNKRRLDAGLWLKKNEAIPSTVADLSIEWEWDNNKAYKDFSKKGGDFEKVLTVSAKAGLAIIHTRTDGRCKESKARGTIKKIIKCNRENNKEGRPIGVIEVRRTSSDNSECIFETHYHNLANPDNNKGLLLLKLRFPKGKSQKLKTLPGGLHK